MAFLSVGSKVPDVAINDQNGKLIKLSDFKGKKLVLYFYPKDLTPSCTVEACNLRDNYTQLLKQGYEVLGVSTDTEKLHKKFIEKEKLPFRLLADTDRKLHEAFGTWIEKSMYGRQYMGTARVTFVIDEKGIVSEVIEKVITKDHASQILGTALSTPKKVVKKATKNVVKAKVAKKAVKTPTKKVKKLAPKKRK